MKVSEDKNVNQKSELTFKWGYKEGFIISFGLLLTGFLFEYFSRDIKLKLSWPVNIVCALVFILILVFFNSYFRKHPLIKFLSGKYNAVSIITTFSMLILLTGIIPQNGNDFTLVSRLGLNHLTSSWPFFAVLIYFLFVLGLVIIRMSMPLKRKNAGFLLNHTGLWIIVFAAGLGSGDLQRFKMVARLNKIVKYAYDINDKIYKMPMAIKLINFNVDTYKPVIAIIDKFTGKLVMKISKDITTIKKGQQLKFPGFDFTLAEFYNDSYWSGNGYIPADTVGSAPSAFVSVVNTSTRDTVSGWISSGSFKLRPQTLHLDKEYILVMLTPEPKRFSSEVQLFAQNVINMAIIEVNKPCRIMGWNLYQAGYNKEMGKWSDISIIELVRDPWLPVVYSGVFMLFAGTVFMFWKGKKIID